MRTRSSPTCILGSLLLATGCGGPGPRTSVDAPPGDDAPPPDAFVPGNLGVVGGETISPDQSWTATDSLGNAYVILREGGTRCVSGPVPGQGLGLFFRCGPIVVGTFPVRDAPPDCTNGEFFTVSVSNTPYGSTWATSGSVEITAVSPTIRGTVSAGAFWNGDYPSVPGSLSGPFEAMSCP